MEASNFNTAIENLVNQFNKDDRLSSVESQCRLRSIESDVDPQVLLDDIKTALEDGHANAVLNDAALSKRSSSGRPRSQMVLEHAEAVIEYQRERINSLEKTIEKFNTAITKTNDMYKEELQKYADENKEIRVQMQKILSDYEALSNRFQIDREEHERLKEKVLIDDSELLKKEEVIKKLTRKLDVLPKENEVLKEEKARLQREVKELKSELMVDVVKNRHPTPPSHQLCDVRKQESITMGKCLIQIENDLLSYKRLSEDQRLEIGRLNHVIDDLKRYNNRPDQFIASTNKQMLQFRQLFIAMVKQQKVLESSSPAVKRAVAMETDIENRSLHAAYVLKATSEQREMYDKLLSVVKNAICIRSNTLYFYSCLAWYRFTSDLGVDGEYGKRSFDVNDGLILVHLLDDSNEHIASTQRLILSDVTCLRRDFRNLEFIVSTHSGHHIIKLDNSDLYNRMYYALQYGGFIVEERKVSVYSDIDFSMLDDDNWPMDLVPVYYTFATDFDGRNVSELLQGDDALEVYLNVVRNVSVISEVQSCLFYYDYDLNVIVIYGPSLANKPKVILCNNSILFNVLTGKRNLDSSPHHYHLPSLSPPNATFPGGNVVDSFFNKPYEVYCLVNEVNNVADVHFIVPRDAKSCGALNVILRSVGFAKDRRVADRDEGGENELEEEEVEEDPPLYKFNGNILELYMGGGGSPIQVDIQSAYYRADPSKKEVVIVTNINTEKRETYVLSIDEDDVYKSFIDDLKLHGLRALEGNVKTNGGQVCIVTKGLIQLFDQNCTTAIPVPIIVFHPDNTNITVDEASRKIMIVQHSEKSIKMTLDCTNSTEFARWKFALIFSGFLKGDLKVNTALKEFIFPIKIFDNDDSAHSAFEVQRDRLLLYTSPNSKDPFLLWEKNNLNIEIFDPDRRVRIYVRKDTKFEERFDLIIPLLNDYNNLVSLLNKSNYPINEGHKRQTSKHRFIISKPGNISMHETKFDKESLIAILTQNYGCDVKPEGLLIKFVSKDNNKRNITLVFKREASFKRWLLALKVAGFIPLSKDNIPILYFPTIVYGFACHESKKLFNDYMI